MPLKAIVDSLDSVPEAARGAYVEKDGKWVLDFDEAENTRAVAANRDRILADKRKADKAMDEYRRVIGDRDPETVGALLTAAERAEEERKLAAGKFDELKQQMAQKHAKDLAAKEAEIARRDAFIRRTLAENAAISILAPVTHSPTLMLPHVLKHIDVVQEGEDWRAVVIDPRSKAPRAGDAAGNPMTIEALVTEMASQPEYAHGFKGTGASGTGAAAASGRVPSGAVAITDTKSFLANLDAIAEGKVAVTGA